ncbi:MAG TPA: Flp pilus assembly protein CpaB [Xanthobacteraceae bacterium]|nr:Flp pilus assembly protein CpaB [Xanthobacteraceae bacterium]
MKAARLVVLGVAIAAGGVAAYLASHGRQASAPEPAKSPAVTLETTDVLVAKTDLGRGNVIAANEIGWQVWPKVSANGNFITKASQPNAIGQFTGAIVRVPLAAGQPIFAPMVVLAKGSGFLAAILPKGMRAVALDITAESSAGGFILPEDHVDILMTHHDKAAEKASGNEKIVTDTILRNVRVLAVDQAVEEKSGQKVAVGRTATVELTPQQAETLAMSRQLGTLSLALRSLVDSQSSTPEGGTASDHGSSVQTIRFGVSTISAASQ